MPVQVKEIMQETAIVVGQDETVEGVARTMLEHQLACVGVVDLEGRLVGVIREEDFALRERSWPFSTEKAFQIFGEWTSPETLERDLAAARSKPAREIMASMVVGIVSEEARLTQALPSLQQGHCLLVVRGERPVGILTRHDLIKLILRGAGG